MGLTSFNKNKKKTIGVESKNTHNSLNNIPGIWIIEIDEFEEKKLVVASERVKEMFGESEQAILVKLCGAQDNITGNEIKKLISGEISLFDGIIRYSVNKTNRKIRETAIAITKGKKRQIIGTLNDITYQEKIETIYTETENTFKQIFNSLSDGIFILDKQGVILDVNLAGVMQTGLSRTELAGRDILEFLFSDTLPEMEFRRLLTQKLNELPSRLECQAFHIKKGPSPFEIQLCQGKYYGLESIIMTARDISERKAEIATAQTQPSSNLLKENLHSHYQFTLDNQLTIRYISNELCLHLGYQHHELQEKLILEIISQPHRKDFHSFFQSIFEMQPYTYLPSSTTTLQTEISLIKKDNSPSCFSLNCQPLTDTLGAVIGFHCSLKEVERIIHQTKDTIPYSLPASDTSGLEKMYSVIAHDLKNPFSSIIGFSNLLLEEYDDFTEEEKLMFISNIHQTGHEALRLLYNLLDWTRNNSGRLQYCPEKLNIENLINEIIDFSHSQAKLKNIRLTRRIHHCFYAKADENMTKTVLRNLISNAIRYSNHNSIVTISCQQENQYLKILISDNGIGMDKKLVEALFSSNEEYRLYNLTPESGTGLGLVLCKEFIKKQGGEFGISSKPGKGSKFWFTLPLWTKN